MKAMISSLSFSFSFSLFLSLSLFFSVIFSMAVFAEDSTMDSISLDQDTTYLIKADLDLNGYYYYIDKTACICWLGSSSGSDPMINVSCKKLAEHAELTPHVVHCEE